MREEKVCFPKFDLLNWLDEQPLFPKIVYRNRIALGSLHTASTLPKSALRYYGTRDFMPRKSDLWEKFPESVYILPEIELWEEGEHVVGIKRSSYPIRPPKAPPENLPIIESVTHTPSLSEWIQQIEHVKALNEKTVLARLTQYTLHEAISPLQLLSTLTRGNAHPFALILEEDLGWIGMTPEFLYSRSDHHIMSHALAGTRKRGENPVEDALFEDELLTSLKDLHEFGLVEDYIRKALAPHCAQLTSDTTKILKTPFVQHLVHEFQGKLLQIDDEALIRQLHPTPATGGIPKKSALNNIYDLENFDRGWYAAPFGFVSEEQSEWLVALRSCMIDGKTLNLFAGTGIVSSSDPLLEWEELDHKMSLYESALGQTAR